MTLSGDTGESSGGPSVVLAHNYAFIRDLIANLLQEGGFRLTGQADSVESLRPLITKEAPDLVLLDWDLPGKSEDTFSSLVQDNPQQVVVLLSPPQPPEAFLAALQSGIKGCLSYNLNLDDFISRLHMLANGDLLISGDISAGISEQLAATEPVEAQDPLSDREREVLSLVACGSTNKEIAEQLTVTENTIKVHLRHIMDKLDLRNRQQAVAFAVKAGLAEDEPTPDSEEVP